MQWRYNTFQPDLSGLVTASGLASGAYSVPTSALTGLINLATQVNGVLSTLNLPLIPTSQLTGLINLVTQVTGTLPVLNLPNIPTSILTGFIDLSTQVTNTLSLAHIPNIPTSILTGFVNLSTQVTGTLSNANVASQLALSNLGADIAQLLGYNTNTQTVQTSTQSQVAALQQAAIVGTVGSTWRDSFNRANASTLGSPWTAINAGTGTTQIANNQATFLGYTTGVAVNMYGPTNSSYQLLTFTLAGNNVGYATSTGGGYAGLVFRSDATFTNCYFVTWDSGHCYLYKRVAGVNTLITSAAYTSIAGQSFNVVMGTATSSAQIQIYPSYAGFSSPTISVTDTSVSASNLYGGIIQGSASSSDQVSAIDDFIMSDNPPQPRQGSGWDIRRTAASSTSNSTWSGTSSWFSTSFDTIVSINTPHSCSLGSSPDVSVGVEGWYRIRIQGELNDRSVSAIGNDYAALGFYTQNSSFGNTQTYWGTINNMVNPGQIVARTFSKQTLEVCADVYLTAGSWVFPLCMLSATGMGLKGTNATYSPLVFTGVLLNH